MIYGFDSDSRDAATAALLVYAIYRSRNRKRFRVTPDMWSQIERFVKASAKRATSLPRFIEALKPRMCCESIHPTAMAVGLSGTIRMIRTEAGELIQPHAEPEQREFLTRVLDGVEHKVVLDLLYRETSWIVLLVRDRLEREKPIENRFETELDEIGREDES